MRHTDFANSSSPGMKWTSQRCLFTSEYLSEKYQHVFSSCCAPPLTIAWLNFTCYQLCTKPHSCVTRSRNMSSERSQYLSVSPSVVSDSAIIKVGCICSMTRNSKSVGAQGNLIYILTINVWKDHGTPQMYRHVLKSDWTLDSLEIKKQRPKCRLDLR